MLRPEDLQMVSQLKVWAKRFSEVKIQMHQKMKQFVPEDVFIGEKRAFIIYDQLTLNAGCFWGKYQIKIKYCLSCAMPLINLCCKKMKLQNSEVFHLLAIKL